MLLRSIKRLFHSMQESAQTLLGTLPRLPVTPHHRQLIKLRSEHGAWTFADVQNRQGSTTISCGLGKDASFDVDFAARYHARVVIADPTPRATRHFEALQASAGATATAPYSPGGAQPISAYDLSKITTASLQLYPRALWNENHAARFLPAEDP